ncbi:MFS domain-containing protein [Mycena indigotica]|uniref:MFS domain-containing protein n=1 Tax=Mycena indigotica TaxID=2126181 RepID=A0A8H6S9M9_9AGAR|nr:MFS domain-containing protein [Mycena indigotica]KAF7294735.1 MFS domain-containing protein [Mycena indigotica]
MPPESPTGKLFALCIGIDEYTYPRIKKLQGCAKDVSSLQDVLLLHYPDAEIISLTNQAATRKNILDSLKVHLTENTHISRDDPILVYFSGYGTRFEEAERDVDALVPHDYSPEIPPIFDFTLHGLFSSPRADQGSQCLILDCCFSAKLTLSIVNIRRIQAPSWSSHLVDLRRENTLADYRGFFADSPPYVLIVASSKHKHCGETQEGGFFTQDMVSAMRSSWPLSCREVNVLTQNWETGTRAQVSNCYGPYLDRLLLMPPKLLPIAKLRISSPDIDLGATSAEDSLFLVSRRWNANIVVHASSQGEANIQRLDRVTARYGTRLIPFALAKASQVLDGVARFNYYLNLRPSTDKPSWVQRLFRWRKSNSSPFSIEAYHFRRDEDNSDENNDAWVSENILHNGVAFLDNVPNDHVIGLKITNTSDQAMYPYVVGFDTDTYEINELYSPLRQDKCLEPKLLKPNESLIFGRCPASTAPTFYAPETPFCLILDEDKVERTAEIFKIILAQKPVVLRYMEQTPPITSGEERTRGAYAHEEIPGVWQTDTITFAVPENFRNGGHLRSNTNTSAAMSRSRSRSRPVNYADAMLPDGPVDEEVFDQLLHNREDTLVDDVQGVSDDFTARRKLPWYKRPSAWWLLVATPFSTIAMSATLAPKVEVYTLLACSVHKPEIFEAVASYVPPAVPPPTIANEIPVSFEIATAHEYPVKECTADPVVSAAVAKLSTAITASMGVLGCLTTGWWGSFSDRFGRTKILGLTLLGLLFNDCLFIFVTKNFTWIPGGYWFLLVGPILEGCLGGFSTASAASHAYLADVVEPAKRSRTFSLFLGTVFAGLGIGPTLGGLLVKSTGNLLSVFYLATAVHVAYALLALLLLPESLSQSDMNAAKVIHRETIRLRNEQEPTLLSRVQRIFGFLRPILIFLPGPVSGVVPLKGRKWDWNLCLLALAYAFAISIMGSMTFKVQYMMQKFGWTSEYLGYFLTIAGVTRAIYMAVILPLLIRFLKGSPQRQSPESQPLISSQRSHHSPSFDLSLAKASLAVDIISYTAMPLASTGLSFTGATIISSFGSGFTPGMQSVALELYKSQNGGRDESGKLFGGLSVIQALSAQILGPSIYGLVFIKTVASFPKAIFLVSLGSIVISFTCVSLVRLPTSHVVVTDAEEGASVIPDHPERDATLVDADLAAQSVGKQQAPRVVISAPSP